MKKLLILILLCNMIALFAGEEFDRDLLLTFKNAFKLEEVTAKTAEKLVSASAEVVKPQLEYASGILEKALKGSKFGLIFSGIALTGSGIYFIYRLISYIRINRTLSKKSESQRKKLRKMKKKYKTLKLELTALEASGPQVNTEKIKRDIEGLKKQYTEQYQQFLAIKKQSDKQKSFIKKMIPSLVLLFGSGALASLAYFANLAGGAGQYLVTELIKMAK